MELDELHDSTGQDRMIDGLPSGERTTTFDVNQQVSTPMPLSQEAEMMKRFSEIVVAAVSGLDTRRCTASIRSAGHQSHASTRHAPFLHAVSACV